MLSGRLHAFTSTPQLIRACKGHGLQPVLTFITSSGSASLASLGHVSLIAVRQSGQLVRRRPKACLWALCDKRTPTQLHHEICFCGSRTRRWCSYRDQEHCEVKLEEGTRTRCECVHLSQFPLYAGKNENEEKRELIFREDGQGEKRAPKAGWNVTDCRPAIYNWCKLMNVLLNLLVFSFT
jgi:hypothetical protein